MKTLAILLAVAIAALPFNASAPEREPKIISFWEGVCIGLVLGCVVDAGIIIVVKCKKRNQQPPNPSTNCPPPQLPIPSTNSLPALTNSTRTATLHAGEAVTWYDLSPASNGFDSLYMATLESSEDAQTWGTAIQITGWTGESGSIVVFSDPQGIPIRTNYIPNADRPSVHTLGLSMLDTKRFFRMRK
jgi:hypothetical protein